MKIVIDKMIEKEMKTGLWMLDRARKYVYLYIRKRKTPFKLRLTEEVDKKINAQDWRFFDELVAKNFTASGNVKREEVDPLLGVKIRKTEERGKAIKKNIAKKSETDINQIMDQLKEKFSYEEKFKHSYYKKTPSLWIKYGKVRLYIPRDAYEQAGYIDLKTGEAFPSRPGNDRILKEALNNKLVKKLINYYRGDLKKNEIDKNSSLEIDLPKLKKFLKTYISRDKSNWGVNDKNNIMLVQSNSSCMKYGIDILKSHTKKPFFFTLKLLKDVIKNKDKSPKIELKEVPRDDKYSVGYFDKKLYYKGKYYDLPGDLKIKEDTNFDYMFKNIRGIFKEHYEIEFKLTKKIIEYINNNSKKSFEINIGKKYLSINGNFIDNFNYIKEEFDGNTKLIIDPRFTKYFQEDMICRINSKGRIFLENDIEKDVVMVMRDSEYGKKDNAFRPEFKDNKAKYDPKIKKLVLNKLIENAEIAYESYIKEKNKFENVVETYRNKFEAGLRRIKIEIKYSPIDNIEFNKRNLPSKIKNIVTKNLFKFPYGYLIYYSTGKKKTLWGAYYFKNMSYGALKMLSPEEKILNDKIIERIKSIKLSSSLRDYYINALHKGVEFQQTLKRFSNYDDLIKHYSKTLKNR